MRVCTRWASWPWRNEQSNTLRWRLCIAQRTRTVEGVVGHQGAPVTVIEGLLVTPRVLSKLATAGSPTLWVVLRGLLVRVGQRKAKTTHKRSKNPMKRSRQCTRKRKAAAVRTLTQRSSAAGRQPLATTGARAGRVRWSPLLVAAHVRVARPQQRHVGRRRRQRAGTSWRDPPAGQGTHAR